MKEINENRRKFFKYSGGGGNLGRESNSAGISLNPPAGEEVKNEEVIPQEFL